MADLVPLDPLAQLSTSTPTPSTEVADALAKASAPSSSSPPSPSGKSAALADLPHAQERLIQRVHDAGAAGFKVPHVDRAARRHLAELQAIGLVQSSAGVWSITPRGVDWLNLNGPIDLTEIAPPGQIQLSPEVLGTVTELLHAVQQESPAHASLTLTELVNAMLAKQAAEVNASRTKPITITDERVRFTLTPDGKPDLLVWADVSAFLAPRDNPTTLAQRVRMPLVPLRADMFPRGQRGGRIPTNGVAFGELYRLSARFPVELIELERHVAACIVKRNAPTTPPGEAVTPSETPTKPRETTHAGPGVYEIRCDRGGVFVTASKNVANDMTKARYLLRRGMHTCKPLQTAWSLYGEDAFSFVFVEPCDFYMTTQVREKVRRDAMAAGRPGLYNPIT